MGSVMCDVWCGLYRQSSHLLSNKTNACIARDCPHSFSQLLKLNYLLPPEALSDTATAFASPSPCQHPPAEERTWSERIVAQGRG